MAWLAKRCAVALAAVLAAVLAASGAAAAGPAYRIVPLTAVASLGRFAPVGLSDRGVVTGTLYPSAGGSFALQADGQLLATADYCGANGAADGTAVISVSPYSARQFILGSCGGTAYFLRNVAQSMTTAPQGPPNGWAVQFTGVGNDGALVGICCDTGSGPKGFYVNGAESEALGSAFTGLISIAPRDTVSYTSGYSCVFPTYVWSPHFTETINFQNAQGWPFDTWPVQANSTGAVIGTYLADCGSIKQPAMPFFWTPGYVAQGRFVLPPGALNATSTQLVALNEKGLVAGNAPLASGQPAAFVWQPRSGQVIIIPPPAGATSLAVAAINNRGAVAGTYVMNGHKTPFIGRCEGAGCL